MSHAWRASRSTTHQYRTALSDAGGHAGPARAPGGRTLVVEEGV